MEAILQLRRVFPLLFSTLIVLLSYACSAPGSLVKPAPDSLPGANLKAQIDALLADSVLAQTRVGIKIVSLQTGAVFYERDSHRLFHPASNMKLLTTATALSRLGTNFKFRTELHADTAAVADSAITGNLYLKGFANPDLQLTDLARMVQQLKTKGIRIIGGDLICDAGYLDDLHWGAGWMWDDASSWYWAPISALTVNDNCVTVRVKPGESIGDSLQFTIEPNTAYMTVENRGFTVDSLDTIQIKQFKVEREWKVPSNKIVIEGGRLPGAEEKQVAIDVVNAPLFVGTVLSEMLNQGGIQFTGQVIQGALPDTSSVLVVHKSEPLSSVVINTNKASDNLSAELLLKTVGAELSQTGTAKAGLFAVKEFLALAGTDTTKLHIVDGSGVSRYNVISPDALINLLQAMHQDFRVQAEFKTSLPIAGVDGTLKRRMKNTSAEGKLRAKTGSLRGVSTLSGYTTTGDGELLAFSMMMEHFVVSTSKIRDIQDRIGVMLSGFHK